MDKSESTAASDAALKAIIRHWPHIPEYARLAMRDSACNYGPKRRENCFPTPKGADWPDVEIVLIKKNEARITIGAITRTYTFEQMGLANERHSDRAKNEGMMLRTYAEHPETGSYSKLPYRKNLKNHISKFRTWLQGFFGIPGDPLHPFEIAQWEPRFKIRAKYL